MTLEFHRHEDHTETQKVNKQKQKTRKQKKKQSHQQQQQQQQQQMRTNTNNTIYNTKKRLWFINMKSSLVNAVSVCCLKKVLVLTICVCFVSPGLVDILSVLNIIMA